MLEHQHVLGEQVQFFEVFVCLQVTQTDLLLGHVLLLLPQISEYMCFYEDDFRVVFVRKHHRERRARNAVVSFEEANHVAFIRALDQRCWPIRLVRVLTNQY